MNASPVLRVSFEGLALGEVSQEDLRGLSPDVDWAIVGGGASVVEDPDAVSPRVLRVRYPAGTILPQNNGTQFLIAVPKAEEYWMSYRVKFEEGFDFALGGKMPGLTSGGSAFTGGRHPEGGQGWSARYMWVEDGGAIVYLYTLDKPGTYGEDLPLPEVRFVPGRWHQLTQHIRVNAPDAHDGVLEVWFDGTKVHEDRAERFRLGDQGLIDSLFFSTFHGGNHSAWAPKTDSAARFDDFIVSAEAPAGLEA